MESEREAPGVPLICNSSTLGFTQPVLTLLSLSFYKGLKLLLKLQTPRAYRSYWVLHSRKLLLTVEGFISFLPATGRAGQAVM